MLLYAVTIFLSAFLLFQVQPIIAKLILPWFGGSAAVWTTCMLFFQTGLLGGYFYSHYVIERLSPRRQAIVHTVLLVISLISLPIIPSVIWKPQGTENPTIRILILLAATVGLPYVILSTTGPLVQAWYARAQRGAVPYTLFALSNLASMLALVSYPFLIEPYLPTTLQGRIWSVVYVVFGALCIYTAWRASKYEPLATPANAIATADGPAAAPSFAEKAYWVSLTACASALMLAVTNHLTQDVASVPFLWIIPLAVYLLSFILTFDARGWYVRNLFLILIVPALGLMALLQDSADHALPLALREHLPMVLLSFINKTQAWFNTVAGAVVAFSVALFICCMVCHGEMSRRKPAARYLTSFYLMLSLGGAMGGLFVGVVAPYLFQNYFELPIALGFCGLLAYRAAVEEEGVPFTSSVISVPGISLAVGMVAIWVFLGYSGERSVKDYLDVRRNFYGTLRVSENKIDGSDLTTYRALLHGAINHGEQWTAPTRRREHLTYYCADSGIGRAIDIHRNDYSEKGKPPKEIPQKVGVLGLGAGSMAAFARAGDDYTFYEINPQVPVIASQFFTYFADAPSAKRILMGDARLTLERQPPQNYDILMMDAFSGDSIPIHLITREAFQIYLRHLKPNGIIVMHISNKFLNLEPVLARIAEAMKLTAVTIEADDYGDGNCFGTTYVLLSPDADVIKPLYMAGVPPQKKADVDLWTDDYSNLYRILKHN